MSRFVHALLAGAAAVSLLMAAAPPSKPHNAKTAPSHSVHTMTTHAAPHSAVHAAPHPAVHAAPHVTTHVAPHVTTHATTVRGYEKTHPSTSARYTPVHKTVTHGLARETVTRLEEESTTRLHEIGRTTTPLGHVTLQRTQLRTLIERRPAITNARFVTGTVVSRQTNTIVLRTQSGSTVTVAAQSVPIPTVLVPGAMVVLPVQYVSNGLVLVPAFTAAQEAIGSTTMLAPCAVNDNDADDAGDTGYYAPAGACLNNDGDADDGFNYTYSALPSSFPSIPQIFTSSYAPVVTSGFVVAQMGSNVLLMTPNFKPMVVNASAALANGSTNGTLTPGRFVTVYGFDVNNTLVATALM